MWWGFAAGARSRQRRVRALSDSGRSRVPHSRALRVSAERVFELARHLTERDREIALALFQHQLLTTDQLTLMFFSSKRRAQDRLRFLYDERVLDRFYPPRPYGLGKPQAHWLLDEGGAILVAASLDVERKELHWRRRDDWGSYPQLLHRLEANRFVTELIAATLRDRSLGVSDWWGSRGASARLSDERRYRDSAAWFRPRWSYVVTLQSALATGGPLAPVWRPLGEPVRVCALSELRARTDLPPFDLSRCLGREWRKERPDFWQALSPLGLVSAPAPAADPESGPAGLAALAPEPPAPSAVERMREQLLAEARQDIE